MTNYGRVRSTVKPEPVRTDDFSVWVHTNIVPVEEPNNDMGPGFVGWEFNMVRYTREEYGLLPAPLEPRVEQLEEQNEEISEILNILIGGD